MSVATSNRQPLLSQTIQPAALVRFVAMSKMTYSPKQRLTAHLHPVPVVGYILNGAAVMKIADQNVVYLPAGSAFYEPANVTITYFANASATQSMQFLATYLQPNPKVADFNLVKK